MRLCVVLILGLTSIFRHNIQAQSDPNARDLRLLTEWFSGEFDNDSQLWLEGRRDWQGPEEEKHHRLHATHLRILVPEIGDHVFYVEEYADDIDSVVTRQRVVSFVSIPDSSFIKMKIFFIKNGERFYLKKTKGKFNPSLAIQDLSAIDGCDVIIRREGEQYRGQMRARQCQFGDEASRRFSVDEILISKNQYWRIDRSHLVTNGGILAGNPSSTPFKLRKAQRYLCDVSFYEKAYYLPSENDKKYSAISIHNQGGSAWLYSPIENKRYLLQIREKEYPFYADGSDFLMMRFKAEESVASSVIVTASPGTENISFNIGTASASCAIQKKP